MKNVVKILILSLAILMLIVGCSNPEKEAPKNEPNASEELEKPGEENYSAFEKNAIEIAKDFVMATEGDKEQIKELAFPTLLKEIEEKNWSIMLAEEIEMDPDSFQIDTEKMGDKQVLVKLSYQGKFHKEDNTIDIDFSNKIGVIELDGKPVVFSFE